MTNESEQQYSDRVGEALKYAADAHNGQLRKGKDEPYLSHILAVAALVAHYGGDEDQIMAGALHDVVEDQGGEPIAMEIGERFGSEVEDIVRDCSDSFATDPQEKLPWQERKDDFLAQVAEEGPSPSSLVEACDKLANLRDIVEDLQAAGGVEALDRFTGGRNGTIWYYNQIGKILMPQVANDPLRRAWDRELNEFNDWCSTTDLA